MDFTRLLILTFLTASFPFSSNAQGVVTIEQYGITELMQKFVENNRAKPEVDGWRVQLLATTDRQKVESEKQRFQTLFPNVSVDWVHTRPYYKLRAGAFHSRLETYKILYSLKREYPSAYPTMDKLRPEELIY